MLNNSGFNYKPEWIRKVRSGLNEHFKTRNIPKERWEEFTWEWVKKKGWSLPNVQN